VFAKDGDRWTTVGTLLAPGAPDPFWLDVPAASVELPKARFVDLGVREAVTARVRAPSGSPVGIDIETVLSAFGVDDRVVVKHVTKSRNLVNRIGEGGGTWPTFALSRSGVCEIAVRTRRADPKPGGTHRTGRSASRLRGA